MAIFCYVDEPQRPRTEDDRLREAYAEQSRRRFIGYTLTPLHGVVESTNCRDQITSDLCTFRARFLQEPVGRSEDQRSATDHSATQARLPDSKGVISHQLTSTVCPSMNNDMLW